MTPPGPGRPAILLTSRQRAARARVFDGIRTGGYELVEVACPACGSQRRQQVADKDMYGLPMGVSVCLECGLVYTSLRLSDAALNRLYSTDYPQLDRGVPVPAAALFADEVAKGNSILQWLERAGVRLSPGRPIVEIGCGPGGVLQAFREHGHEVIGFDIGPEYLEFGRSRGLELHEGDTRAAADLLRSRDHTPDLVIYEQAFEHMAAPREELRVLRVALDERSHLFIGVPGLRRIPETYGSNFARFLQIPHLSHFELATLTQLAETEGFRRVAGDEQVRAVFRLAEPGETPDPPATDAAGVAAYLEGMAATHRRRGLHARGREAWQRLRWNAGRLARELAGRGQ